MHSHFDNFIGRKRSGSKHLNNIIEKSQHLHTFGGGKGRENKKLMTRYRVPKHGQVRLTCVAKASKSSKASARLQHCWPGEKLRQEHFRKQRCLSNAQRSIIELERTQKMRVMVMKDGKLVVSEDNAVLASKAYLGNNRQGKEY